MSHVKIISDGKVRGGTKVLVDGQELRGVQSIEIEKLDAGGDQVVRAKITLVMTQLDIEAEAIIARVD